MKTPKIPGFLLLLCLTVGARASKDSPENLAEALHHAKRNHSKCRRVLDVFESGRAEPRQAQELYARFVRRSSTHLRWIRAQGRSTTCESAGRWLRIQRLVHGHNLSVREGRSAGLLPDGEGSLLGYLPVPDPVTLLEWLTGPDPQG